MSRSVTTLEVVACNEHGDACPELAEVSPRRSGPYTVAVYDVGQRYGGPEEGGWWYNVGTLVRAVKMFRNEESAYAYCRRLNDKLHGGSRERWLAGYVDGLNGRRSNVDPSNSNAGEWLAAEVHEGQAPAGYPDRKPHYE